MLATLNMGYYQAPEDGDMETILFIKKHRPAPLKFYSIYANDGEIREVARLDDEERKLIIDYCRYRFGIDTELKSQDEVEGCRRE